MYIFKIKGIIYWKNYVTDAFSSFS